MQGPSILATDAARPRGAGRPRRHDTEELDRFILARARQSFLTRGFGPTTIERVASDCGTTRRTIMHRFPDKDALLIAVLGVTLKQDLSTVLDVDPVQDRPTGLLRRLCRRMLDYATDPLQYGMFRVFLGEIVRLPAISCMLIEHHDRLRAAIESAVLDAQASGDFQDHHASAVADGVIGVMLANPVNRAMMGDPRFHSTQEIEHYFEEMWNMLTC